MDDSIPTEITHDFPPFFRVHSTGRIERYLEPDLVSPSDNPRIGVVSRDVLISPQTNVSARVYLPRTTTTSPPEKLPLLIYIHGGGFSIESAFSKFYDRYVSSLASESKSVVVSVDYRLAPEHPIPACYDDGYDVLRWIDSHTREGQGPDPWLNEHADFGRLYVAGDSAGANIGHDMIIRATENGLGLKIAGLVLIHPFFGGSEPDRLWDFICPYKTGLNNFRMNPVTDSGRLAGLGCERMLVCLAEKDFLRDRGLNYYHGLKKSGWKGSVEFYEAPGEMHVFHLFDPGCEEAVSLMKRIVSFVNSGTHVMSHF